MLRARNDMRVADFAILVVEDEPNDQFLIQRGLGQNATHLVHCVTTGQQAIAYLKGAEPYSDRVRFPFPRLLITDLQMGFGDGLSVLQRVKGAKSRWRLLPTVVLS